MFCRKCGEKLRPADRFCSRCGEPAGNPETGETPIIPEPPKDLVWNVTGFPKEGKETKTPDLDMEWKPDPSEGPVSEGTHPPSEELIESDRDPDIEELQQRLDAEIEKINRQNLLREEALARAREEKALQDRNPQEDTPPPPTTEMVAEAPEEPAREILQEASIQNTKAEPEVVTAAAAPDDKFAQIFIDDEEEEKEKKKFTFGKFLLILLLLLVLAEATFLGLRAAMPDNPYVQAADKQMAAVVETVKSWFEPKEGEPPAAEDPVLEEEEQQEPEPSTAQEPAAEVPAAEPDPYPTNKNIQDIRENPELKYISGKNYGLADINTSLPVTESTEEVINTIVAYDSAWIDYVNNGDKGVIEYTAQGSKAQQNTLSFSKVGKINEVFNLLEIGEVRKGTKGYYVWVREEIEITENNRTTNKAYRWIYQVAPSDTGMKIVNYFPY